ncbi:uncharacterized protein RHOBADRAFT_43971 [Rhodotorula graminis WP1]|uniref:PWI domain-containing protein n=1 Tax=Rhodotorula graminis (strain WP1) TaxID=578459 RepID=A0A194S7T3_RHOGW|nr:uncharacterized protein RHOBADRAFT_43971 [Rhodotorula graminis WP1]KPV75466.1 hypothetical protein RHOBADRAFT_43971 [Rhodotorula graminis WP1]
MTSFRGISLDQDPRFKDKQAALLAKTSFPATFNTKVDIRKVEMAVMKPWITKKVIELLGFEDDVLLEYIFSLLEDNENPVVDGKQMQLLLTGFLEAKTPAFMSSLWDLLLSAQSNPLRVPTALLEEKKREMRAREEQEALRRREEEHLDEGRGGYGGRGDDRGRDAGFGPRGGGGGYGGERDGGYGGYGPRGGGGGGGRGGYGVDAGPRGGRGGGVPARSLPLPHTASPTSPSSALPLALALSFALPTSSPPHPLPHSLAQPVARPGQASCRPQRDPQPQPQPQQESEPAAAAQEVLAESQPEPVASSEAPTRRRRARGPLVGDAARRSRWEQDDSGPAQVVQEQDEDLSRRESELKEGLLRKKVVASRSSRS